MGWLADIMSLTVGEAIFALTAAFAAGLVRGFSGFALSALLMASLVIILPPAEIIAICLILETVATTLMFRGGYREADKKMVFGLIAGVVVGVPLGLWVILTVPEETSKLIALSLILVLALAQLGGFRPAFLATRPGLLGSGVAAGLVQGTAASGGMVVALYALARQAPAATMRASLVFYLTLSILSNLVFYSLFGLITSEAVMRSLAMALPVALGVLLGARLFSPRLQPYYRTFCLCLLTGLALLGLVRAPL